MVRVIIKKEWQNQVLQMQNAGKVGAWGCCDNIGSPGIWQLRCEDLFNILVDLPSIPPEFVKVVTVVDRIFGCERPNGMYEMDGAALKSKTIPDPSHIPVFAKEISIRANSLEAAKAIYAAFLQGTIKPTVYLGPIPAATPAA